MKKILILLLSVMLLSACSERPSQSVLQRSAPPIYPDYADVTIPVNIAPLNFMVRGNYLNVFCVAEYADGQSIEAYDSDGGNVCFDEGEWKKMLTAAKGKDIKVSVYTHEAGDNDVAKRWEFAWHVAADSIDSHMTYRLIEPDYEVWNRLAIEERCLENWDTRHIADHALHDNACMNCHVASHANPNRSMLYIRGANGGAMLNENGAIRKLAIKTDSMVSSSVYYDFSGDGRFIVFSTNIIMPAFHAQSSKRLEVFDTQSDVYVADLQSGEIFSSPTISSAARLETFPAFAPDMRSIYYCVADTAGLGTDVRQLRYSLVRVSFDAKNRRIGTVADTLYSASRQGGSVCLPRVSPDGRWLVFTIADYGTFPIWHPETDLRMLDLQTGCIDPMDAVNSGKSDTYHSWSSNGRWLCFASKRDDGLYGKPYFSHIDRQGKAHKPFVLPQKSPEFYDLNLKSFNLPELIHGPLPFDALDMQRATEKEAEEFRMRPY